MTTTAQCLNLVSSWWPLVAIAAWIVGPLGGYMLACLLHVDRE